MTGVVAVSNFRQGLECLSDTHGCRLGMPVCGVEEVVVDGADDIFVPERRHDLLVDLPTDLPRMTPRLPT